MNSTVKIILGVLVIAILGVGVSLATHTWDPMWNPFRPSPDKVIEKSVEAQKEVESSHTEGELKLDFESPSVAFEAKVNFDQDTDSSDPSKMKSKSNIKADISIEKAENVDANIEGITLNTEVDVRVLDNKIYFKVNKIPPLPNTPQAMSDKIKGQWIESEMNPQTTEEEVDEELQEKIKDIIKLDKLLDVEKEYPYENIGGVESYHYLVSLNKEEVKKELPELAKVTSPQTSEEEVEDMKENLDKFFEEAGPIEAEVWIGQKKLLLRKVKFDKKIDSEDFEEGKKGSLNISLMMKSSDFGKSVEVKKPEDAKTIQELMMSMMGGGKFPGPGSPTMPEDMPEDYNIPEGTNLPEDYEIPEGTNVPQLPLQDFGGPAFLLQGMF